MVLLQLVICLILFSPLYLIQVTISCLCSGWVWTKSWSTLWLKPPQIRYAPNYLFQKGEYVAVWPFMCAYLYTIQKVSLLKIYVWFFLFCNWFCIPGPFGYCKSKLGSPTGHRRLGTCILLTGHSLELLQPNIYLYMKYTFCFMLVQTDLPVLSLSPKCKSHRYLQNNVIC